MKIEDITIKKINKKSNLKAVVSINLDNILVVHGVRLVEGENGLFLSFPAMVRGKGKFLDIVHPIDTEFREVLTDAIVTKYHESV